MAKIIYLPFENLPQRYTGMWNTAIIRHLRPDDIVVKVSEKESQISVGEFLDIYDTTAYKSRQLDAVSLLFKEGKIENGDIFYVPDIFFPGLEAIRYMADLAGIKVKIAAFNHAGRADKDDFVQRLGLWADAQEATWHQMCDLVMVGSQYQKERVDAKFDVNSVVVGAVWDTDYVASFYGIAPKIKNSVIWPHRPCAEKRFDLFLEAARNNPELHFIITSGGPCRIDVASLPSNVDYLYNLTKKDYYRIFAHSEGYLSTAYQETFGYTIQEAIYYGCKIICPNHACYPEFVAPQCLASFEDIGKPGFLTEKFSEDNLAQSQQFSDNAEKIIQLIHNV